MAIQACMLFGKRPSTGFYRPQGLRVDLLLGHQVGERAALEFHRVAQQAVQAPRLPADLEIAVKQHVAVADSSQHLSKGQQQGVRVLRLELRPDTLPLQLLRKDWQYGDHGQLQGLLDHKPQACPLPAAHRQASHEVGAAKQHSEGNNHL